MVWVEEVTSMHLILLCLMLPLTLLLIVNITARRRRRLPLPPGPTPLPIIGNMLLMDQLTHRGLARLAKLYGGLLHLRLGFVHHFVVSTPDVARQVLQVQDSVFSDRPATTAVVYLTYNRSDLAFAQCGPYWRQMRKLCVMKLFSRKHAESWLSIPEEVDAAVCTVAKHAGSAFNVRDLAFTLTKNIVFRSAFGKRSDENQEEYIAVVREISALLGAFSVGDFIPWLSWMDPQGINKRLRVARATLDLFIDRIIDDEHMATDAANADMVGVMLAFLEESSHHHRQGEGDDLKGTLRLSRANISAVMMDVMFGGTETVAIAIEWALADLLTSPDDLKRVQEELAMVVGLHRKVHESHLDKLSFLKCAIKETLRLHPPFPLLLHQTADHCEVAGYSIPARSPVMINVWAIGRDESAWKDADAYRPSRFAPGGDAAALDFKGNCFEFLPFGSGRRSCPGMQLGMHELELAVAQLLHCFTWALPDGMKPTELDMGDVFGLSAPKAVPLVAVPTPRLSCPLN
ncbi:unnamed protein product [Musa hybrid cultivar]